MPELVLCYKSTCPFCLKVLRYLEEHHISVPMKEISQDLLARDELIRAGGKTQVPCLLIDGKALYESDDIIQWFKDSIN